MYQKPINISLDIKDASMWLRKVERESGITRSKFSVLCKVQQYKAKTKKARHSRSQGQCMMQEGHERW